MRKNSAHQVEALVRGSVAAILNVTGETWTELGAAVGLTTDTVSRRQKGTSAWTIADLGRLGDHWRISPSSLVSGPTEALATLSTERVKSIRSAKGLPTTDGVLVA
ncbi:helix-turn-helix domain-containing protein [Streptomyces xanthophaeus]